MNPMPELAPQLKQLRLSGILDSLEARNRQAIDAKLAYTEFLAMLIGDEIARREQKKFSLRLRRATFRATKTLEQFDFDRLPQLNRAQVHDLATGRYLHEHAPVLIVGPCGTGKSHLAQALGHCAVRHGVDVVFTSCAALTASLATARATGTYERKLASLARVRRNGVERDVERYDRVSRVEDFARKGGEGETGNARREKFQRSVRGRERPGEAAHVRGGGACRRQRGNVARDRTKPAGSVLESVEAG